MAPASRTRYTAADVRQVLPYYDNFADDSDASDIVIEVLCNHFCGRLSFVYDHTMWTAVVRPVSGRHCQCPRRQDRRDVVD